MIHLAAQTLVGPAIEDPVDTFSKNIEGTWSVLEACRSVNTVERIVVASSDKAYGDASGRPYREEAALRARHPYDTSKAVTDMLAQTYAFTYGLPVAITRCGNLYGGGDLNWSRIVPGTIRSVLEGESPVIRSDGTFVRDYLYVRDAAAGVLVLAEAVGDRPELAGTAFNFAAGARLSVIDIVRRILRPDGLGPRAGGAGPAAQGDPRAARLGRSGPAPARLATADDHRCGAARDDRLVPLAPEGASR